MFSVLVLLFAPYLPVCHILAAFVLKSLLWRIVCWSDGGIFFANLHFDSRNSAFQRPCNPAHHPTFGTQKNRKIEKKKKEKTRAKEALSFAVSFLGLERRFLPRHPSHVKMLALRFTPRCPAEVASQRYGSIWLSVRMMITAKLILLHWTIQGCALHPHGFLEMRHF